MRIVVILSALTLVLATSVGAAEAPTPEQTRFFESRVRPVLAEHCLACHGPDKQRGKLRLDSAAALQSGGASGPVVVPGQPDRSLLVRMVRHEDDLPRMPPRGKLSPAQVADLTRWVQSGAAYPTTPVVGPRAGERHWAFERVRPQAAPEVKSPGWVRTPIDRFILARLEARGLSPAAEADRHTLIRRVTYDLTGLPPTPEEVEAFLTDQAPGAYERLVERLLASPHHGERWGRHWLDVARYADSNGLDENIAHGNAWRYRDWVVAAVNHDLPYDEFVRAQLAGDLMPATESRTERPAHLVATGFLALGPKVLAEVDERKMELDIVDEQLDTVGKAFLGLTLGCARCHDHKFDPVTAEDYYALAGIFQSTRTMESFRKIARWHENSLATPAEEARQRDHAARLAAVQSRMKASPPPPAAELTKLKDEFARLKANTPVLPTAMGVTEGKVADTPLLRRGDHLKPGKPVPRRFPLVLAGDRQPALPTAQSGRRELAAWITDPAHPLTARVMVNRVWRWHFGEGLSRSVDNFGLLGEKPSHPELLDWLAGEFVRSGWSLKHLHRLIVTSAVYRQDSSLAITLLAGPAASRVDPENILLGRRNPRRLEAEGIRNALLSVGGELDTAVGGPAITHVGNREFLFDHTSKDGTKYDSPRRSLYLPVIRNNLYDVFQFFDAPDPAVGTGDRSTTTVATQALFLMNGELALRAAGRLADALLARADMSDGDRVRRLYLTTLGRPATPTEVERASAALVRFDAALAAREGSPQQRRREAWAVLAQALLAANEFVYVR